MVVLGAVGGGCGEVWPWWCVDGYGVAMVWLWLGHGVALAGFSLGFVPC